VKIKLQVIIPKKTSSNICLRALTKPAMKRRNKQPKNVKKAVPGILNENPVIIPRNRNRESLIMVKFKNCIPIVFCRAAIIF
jgi:hypothetical protein